MSGNLKQLVQTAVDSDDFRFGDVITLAIEATVGGHGAWMAFENGLANECEAPTLNVHLLRVCDDE